MVCTKSAVVRFGYPVRLCGRGFRCAVLALTVFGLCLCLFAPGSAQAAAPVNACGTISTDTVWTASNVYLINNCSTVVAAGVTLTVQPGTVVKFADYYDVLVIQGRLDAQGTAEMWLDFT